MKAFMRILAYGKPFGRYWPSYLVLSVLSVLFGIANYALIAPLLTVLFEPDTLTGEIARPEYSFSVAYVSDLFRFHLGRIRTDDGVLMALAVVAKPVIQSFHGTSLVRVLRPGDLAFLCVCGGLRPPDGMTRG